MYWIVLVFFILLTLVLAFFCYNLYQQVIQFELLYQKQVKKETDIDNFYRYILGLLTRAYGELQRVDKGGAFAADDEVGFAFKIIYRAIEDTKNQLEAIRVTEKTEEHEK